MSMREQTISKEPNEKKERSSFKMLFALITIAIICATVITIIIYRKRNLSDIVMNDMDTLCSLKQEYFEKKSDVEKCKILQVYADCVTTYLNMSEKKVVIVKLQDGIFGYTDGKTLYINSKTLNNAFLRQEKEEE